jgi:hypothetical protein
MLESYLEGANNVDAELQSAMLRGYVPVRRAGNINAQLSQALLDELEGALERILEYEASDEASGKGSSPRALRIITYLQRQAYLTGSATRRADFGENLVLVVLRRTGTEDCARYVGRVFVDDIYSSGEMYQHPRDYSSWHTITGRFMRRARYPMLSEAVAGGLYHYGCKCWHISYFEGVTQTDSQGVSLPSFVGYDKTPEPIAPEPEIDDQGQRMNNFAEVVEASTLAREVEMGNIANLHDWLGNILGFLGQRRQNVSGSITNRPGTDIIVVTLSADGTTRTAEFRPGVDGTTIDSRGNVFVDPQLLWEAFGRIISPPIIHTPVRDAITTGLAVGGARTVGRMLNWLDLPRSFSVPQPARSASIAARCARPSRREELINSVENRSLKNVVNELYRPNARIGDGGTAAALRHEIATGLRIGQKNHLTKAREKVKNIQRIIERETLSQQDLEIALQLLEDLLDALGGM